MRMRRLAGSDSESGLISVSAVLAIAFVALIVYLLLAALDADTDHYGAIPIPSENAAVELPAGETDIYLAEKGDPEKLPALQVPADLAITFTAASGDTVRVDDRDGDIKETDDGVARVVSAVIAPDEGTYFVTVSSEEARQLVSPSLTFGLSPLGAVEQRFKDIIEELKGPTGIVVLIALAALMLAPRVQRAFDR